ncbi:MAG: hypothetical protein IPP28_03865 [Xanthomonadales bacterium]|nr:hypothetical protein [Xanthomonadales bacterium]
MRRRASWIALWTLALAGSASAAEWLRWTTAALPDAPAFCCATRHAGALQSSTCKLEGGNDIYGSVDGAPRSDTVQVYARYDAGVLAAVRVYDGACAVQTTSPVRELGALEASASLSRLLGPISDSQRAVQDRLVAVALHLGEPALDWLKQRSRAGARDERRDAWFWLGQRLGVRVEPLVREALPKADAELREHLVFVLSQMPGAAGVDALITLVEDRRLDRDLRSRALFWLAQSEDARAFAYLDRRLDPAGS